MSTLIYDTNNPKIKALREKNPNLIGLFDRIPLVKVTLHEDPFSFLVYTIIGQQISMKQADRIFDLITKGGRLKLTPEKLESFTDEIYKNYSIPRFKIPYLKSLIIFAKNNHLSLETLSNLSTSEQINHLTRIHGIGKWSAEMFCMFVLGNENVFSENDLVLRTALKHYLNQELSLKEIREIAQQWHPYKSIVAHYLWHYWENTL